MLPNEHAPSSAVYDHEETQDVLAISESLKAAKNAGIRLECSYWNTEKNAVKSPHLDPLILQKRAQQSRCRPGLAEEFWRLIEGASTSEQDAQSKLDWRKGYESAQTVAFEVYETLVIGTPTSPHLARSAYHTYIQDLKRIRGKYHPGPQMLDAPHAKPSTALPPTELKPATTFPIGNLPLELVYNITRFMSPPTALALIFIEPCFTSAFAYTQLPRIDVLKDCRAFFRHARIGFLHLLQKDIPGSAVCHKCQSLHMLAHCSSYFQIPAPGAIDPWYLYAHEGALRSRRSVFEPCVWLSEILDQALKHRQIPSYWLYRGRSKRAIRSELYQFAQILLDRPILGDAYGLTAPIVNRIRRQGVLECGRSFYFEKIVSVSVEDRKGEKEPVAVAEEKYVFFVTTEERRRWYFGFIFPRYASLCGHTMMPPELRIGWRERAVIGGTLFRRTFGPLDATCVDCGVNWKVLGRVTEGDGVHGASGETGMRFEVCAREVIGCREKLNAKMVEWVVKSKK